MITRLFFHLPGQSPFILPHWKMVENRSDLHLSWILWLTEHLPCITYCVKHFKCSFADQDQTGFKQTLRWSGSCCCLGCPHVIQVPVWILTTRLLVHPGTQHIMVQALEFPKPVWERPEKSSQLLDSAQPQTGCSAVHDVWGVSQWKEISLSSLSLFTSL